MRRRKSDLHARVNRNLPLEFDDVRLTSYAGLELLERYLRTRRFNQLVREAFADLPRGGDFGVVVMVRVFVGLVIVGGRRLRHLASVADDPIFQRFGNVRVVPTARTLSRWLRHFTMRTVTAMLHRLRSVLVRPGRDRLAGAVEVDETYIGGEEPGLRGGRARGKKVLTGIAVEVQDPKGLGRCRMGPLPDASASSLHGFVTDHVEPGARVITDGWQGYHGVEQLGYLHDRHSQRAALARGDDPHELLPAVHRVASLVKRWLLGTHQGSVGDAHLPGYLNEFVFRFNRRRSRSRGLVFFRVLQLAATHAPVRYQDLVAHTHPRALPPTPPPTRGHPPSLERPPANRPWRAVDLGYSG